MIPELDESWMPVIGERVLLYIDPDCPHNYSRHGWAIYPGEAAIYEGLAPNDVEGHKYKVRTSAGPNYVAFWEMRAAVTSGKEVLHGNEQKRRAGQAPDRV